MTKNIQNFITELRAAGIAPHSSDDIISDDTFRYYRIEGDKQGTKKGSYVFREEADGFSTGFAMSHKTGERVTWVGKTPKKATTEQRDEWAARRKESEERREREIAALRDRARVESARLWSDADDAADIPYLEKKGLGDWSARKWMDFERFEEVLLVPCVRGVEMVGLQKVYPDGSKLFVTGSDITGSYCEIPGDNQVAVCEGYATGVTIHKATGWTVRVAFNAGNLRHVVSPGCLIASDEDLWTWGRVRDEMPEVLPERDAPEWSGWRDRGLLVNTGRDKAMEAASVIGGAQVLYPVEGGDWNDVMVRDGLDSVRERLMGLVELASNPEEYTGWVPDDLEEVGPIPDQKPADILEELTGPLGYDKDVYFFLPKTKGQIIELTATALGSANNLYQLGNQYDYRRVIGEQAEKASEMAQVIGPMLIDMCHKKGVYEPEKVYGAGAWNIGGKLWLNTGREVYCPSTGVSMGHTEAGIDGVFVKEAKAYDVAVDALGNVDANKLIQICQMLKWKRPISGTLLAGWLVVAAVGGALRWRPHIFITGIKGAGKSTVVDHIIDPVLKCALRQDGGSTEAGLRRQVGDSSRPFRMDEFEGELLRDKENVQKIFTWTRKASSGGMIVNANGTYRARSCVVFAAINPMIIQGADADRISILEMEVNKTADAEEHYNKLMEMIHENLTSEYADRLVKRTIDNIDALLKNCDTFSKHASRILGSKRAGDQVGPMLAGAYMLHTTGVVTDERAEEYCGRQDWSWIDEQQDGTDSERLVRKILNSMIEYSTMDKTVRMPVSEMIARVMHPGSMDSDACVKALSRVGMAVRDGWLCVANSDDGLSTLLKDTPWVVYRPGLSRFEGCISDGKTMRFGSGNARRYMKIPLGGLIEGAAVSVGEVELDWEDGAG